MTFNIQQNRRSFLISALSATALANMPFLRDAKAQEGVWPRVITTSKGDITIASKPQRIVSTSVTLTGTLLAIAAPVIASSATNNTGQVGDEVGFFTQWSEVAKQRAVQPLYRVEPDVEAIVAAEPDLIIMAATGGDSALRLYDQISQIAPTIVVNYDDKSWQEIAVLLGKVTGHEAQALNVIREFDAAVKKTAQAIRLPPQPTSAIVYFEDDSGANVWTPFSAQGKLLTSLGFTLALIPSDITPLTTMGIRSDIIQLGGERLADGLTGNSMLIFAAEDQIVDQVYANKFLQHIPALVGKQVFAVGDDTFRLDYYSATNLLARLERLFSN